MTKKEEKEVQKECDELRAKNKELREILAQIKRQIKEKKRLMNA